jgi:acyl-CoA dehydrogenase
MEIPLLIQIQSKQGAVMQALAIPTCTLDASCESLRREVRAFIRERLAGFPRSSRAQSWMGIDPEFSRSLGARGWVGMTWPKKYGGHERTALERYVVVEELLAAGAPVMAHWIGDRQSGPMLLRYGSEEQRMQVLPGIARGETIICVGMSEPNTGSDLASVRCRAEKVSNGWIINGSKIWISLAHVAHYMMALLRTGTDPNNRHGGLSSFLIDMRTPGITVRPIRDLSGHSHFNEVFFDDVHVPAGSVIGREGDGWKQITHELAFERSGPERYLSSFQLFVEMLNAASPDDPRHAVTLGRVIAEMAALRQMSLGIAGMLARDENPDLIAAIFKDLGTAVEQKIPEMAHDLFDIDPSSSDSVLGEVMAVTLRAAPSSTLRGGTREILRGIIAKGLELR